MVGYGTISDPDEPKVADGNYIMWRFMIDKKYQGKGYAKPILDKVMEYIRTFPAKPAEKIWLSYEKENERARKIYRDYGFVENGEICADEIVAVYDL